MDPEITKNDDGESSVWTLKSPRMMTGVIATWNPEDRCKSMVLGGHELHQHPGGSVLILLSFSSNRQHNSIHSRCVRGRVKKAGIDDPKYYLQELGSRKRLYQ